MIRLDRHTYENLVHLVLVGCIFVLFTACSNDDAPVPADPVGDLMSFSVGMAEDAAVTRGEASTPVTTQFQDFRLYGVKKVTGVLETVFEDYGFVQQTDTVNHTTYWEYATYRMNSTDSAKYSRQSYQYWDYDASEYRLIAGAPYDKVSSIDPLCGTLTLSGLRMGDADLTVESESSPTYVCPYFSAPAQLLPVDYGDVIGMRFQHSLCQVQLAFYFETEQVVDMSLVDITFGPAGDGLYATQGDLTVSYVFEPTPEWTATVSYTGTGRDNKALKYADVTVLNPGTTTDPATGATPSTTSHYMLPTYGQPCIWTLSLTASPNTEILDKKSKTANVPAADMQWQPNTIYTYIFKITDTGLGYFGVIRSAVAGWTTENLDDHSVHNW